MKACVFFHLNIRGMRRDPVGSAGCDGILCAGA